VRSEIRSLVFEGRYKEFVGTSLSHEWARLQLNVLGSALGNAAAVETRDGHILVLKAGPRALYPSPIPLRYAVLHSMLARYDDAGDSGCSRPEQKLAAQLHAPLPPPRTRSELIAAIRCSETHFAEAGSAAVLERRRVSIDTRLSGRAPRARPRWNRLARGVAEARRRPRVGCARRWHMARGA
jgi:hypothetical protein